MPSSFTITANTNSIQLDGNRSGRASFTVFNGSGQSRRGRAQITDLQPVAGSWFSLEGEIERDFNIGGTSQYTVRIAVPPAAPAGNYSFRLNMVGVDNPDDDFTEGQAVTFEVPEPEEKKPLPWKIPAIVAAVIVVALAVGVGMWIFNRDPKIPDVAGLTVFDASATLEKEGITVAIETRSEADDSVPKDRVIKTVPEAGANVSSKDSVILVVSKGKPVEMRPIIPDVAGSTTLQASKTLTDAGFTVSIDTIKKPSNEIKTGQIIGTNPPFGAQVAPGSQVVLVQSSGPIEVPDVVGETERSAIKTLEDAGFKVSEEIIMEASEDIARGRIIRVEPVIDTENGPGSQLVLVESSGPPNKPPKVPDVAGVTELVAIKTLTDAGFKFAAETPMEPSEVIAKGMIIRTEPAIGTEQKPGTEVVLFVSSGPPQIIVPEVKNLSVIDATRVITLAKLEVAEITKDEYSNEVLAGMVVGTEPPKDSAVEIGSEITLILSLRLPEPVSWWAGEGRARDSIGPNDGIQKGDVSYVPGKVGQAFSFDGVNDTVEIQHHSSLKPSAEITIAAWVRPNDVNSLREIFRKEDGNDRILLSFQPSPYCSPVPAPCLAFGLSKGGIYAEFEVGGSVVTALTDGTFHHVAATYDGSVKKIYIDGDLRGSTPASGPIGATGSAPAYIGSAAGGSEFFDGEIDELRFYDKALSQEEIQCIVNDCVGPSS